MTPSQFQALLLDVKAGDYTAAVHCMQLSERRGDACMSAICKATTMSQVVAWSQAAIMHYTLADECQSVIVKCGKGDA